jgi:hypothetical protein
MGGKLQNYGTNESGAKCGTAASAGKKVATQLR